LVLKMFQLSFPLIYIQFKHKQYTPLSTFFIHFKPLKKNPPFLKKFCFQHTIQTSNRVEWAHALLKMFPMKSLGDIWKKWKSINIMLTRMFIELHKKFQKSIISRESRFTRTVLRSELQGNIFRHVPYFLAEEVRRVEATGTNKSKCKCLLMLTMGLVYVRLHFSSRLEKVNPLVWHIFIVIW
jgi:hypothetical protein